MEAAITACQGIAAKKKMNWPTSRKAWQSTVTRLISSPSLYCDSVPRVRSAGLA